jgi:hypothetical protein
MMMALHFELVTPAKLVRSEDVYMVVVPGAEGEFGVLEGHAPFMSHHPRWRGPGLQGGGQRAGDNPGARRLCRSG